MSRRIALLVCFLILAVSTMGVALAATTSVQKEARIVARLLESGKVEFGLQERTDGGEWGETLLPTVNKFPYASATVDRWLQSSAVALTPVEFDAIDEELRPDPVTGSIAHWRLLAGSNAEGEVFAYMVPEANTASALALGCLPDGLDVAVATQEYLLNDRGTDQITVWYRVEGGELQSARWASSEGLNSFLHSSEPEDFVRWLSFNVTQSTTFYFSVTGRYGNSYHGTFDLTGIHAVVEALPCFSVT